MSKHLVKANARIYAYKYGLIVGYSMFQSVADSPFRSSVVHRPAESTSSVSDGWHLNRRSIDGITI